MPEQEEEMENDRHRDGIVPEPPDFIKHIKWFLLYRRKARKYIVISLVIAVIFFAFVNRGCIKEFFSEMLSGKQSSLESETPEKKHMAKPKVPIAPAEQEKAKPSDEKKGIFQNIPTFVSNPIPSEKEVSIELRGSFENVKVLGAGSLIVSLSTDKKIARYERIFFESDLINTTLYGRFTNTSDFKDRVVKLNMNFKVYFETKYPSKELAVLPKEGGGFKVEHFFTSDCNFSCYQLRIAGDWVAHVDGKKRSGKIDSFFSDRGLGADTRSEIELSSHPTQIALRNFRWRGNTGGVKIPLLVDEVIDDIPIRVSAQSVSTGFFAIEHISLLAQK